MAHHAYSAMHFARRVHSHQQRKYTSNPYHDHLAEVAGIIAASNISGASLDTQIAVCWLHDCMEDQGVTFDKLAHEFSYEIASGVLALTKDKSDTSAASREERAAAYCLRLAAAPGWVQSIKCADIVSNLSSLLRHDPKFAARYLPEKSAQLAAMTYADPRLMRMARTQVNRGMEVLGLLGVA